MAERFEMLAVIPKMGSDVLHVTPGRCLEVRHRKAECYRCAKVCTSGAISLSEDGVAVDPALCTGCGTCASVCPTGCLEAQNPTDEDLVSRLAVQAQSGGHAAIACAKATQAARDAHGSAQGLPTLDGIPVSEVVCLGRVEESVLAEAAVRGVSQLTLVDGGCADCPHATGNDVCNEVLACANSLFAAFGAPVTLSRTTAAVLGLADGILDEKAPKHSSGTSNPDDDNLAENEPDAGHYAHVQPDGTLPHFVPVKRLRLFNSLKRLGEPQQEQLACRLWGRVTINTELCSSCRMCTVFCPTGALVRYDAADGTFGVEHRCTYCVQCRLCETLCPEQALTVSDAVPLAEFALGRKVAFEMMPLEFKPGGADSISTRMARFVKVDAYQDPQGTMDLHEVVESRKYALDRAKRREEIRNGD